MIYQLILFVHIVSAIVFIGTVYFRTIVIGQKKLPTPVARTYASIAVGLLALSGVFLFFRQDHRVLLDIKVTLAIIVISMFIFAPKISSKIKYFHEILLVLMLCIVFLAKVWFL